MSLSKALLNIPSYERLFYKYKNNHIVIDTNLLLLLLIGATGKDNINKSNLTNDKYDKKCYNILLNISSNFDHISTTNILTETTNQLKNDRLKNLTFPLLKKYFSGIKKESNYKSNFLGQLKYFYDFGLTDMSIYQLAFQKVLVLTDDGELYTLISNTGNDVIKFSDIVKYAKIRNIV